MPETGTIHFTVPPDAELGSTMMRVRLQVFWRSPPQSMGPCNAYIYFGEAEDYIVNIVANPSPPVADFMANNTLPPDSSFRVNFTDQSAYSPGSWAWTITPASHTYHDGTNDTSQNPVVSFTAVGPYSITLQTTNQYGSDTITKTAFIHQGTPGLWTGSTNSDWDTTTNWHNHMVPKSAIDVSITTAATNMPVKTGNLTIGTDCNSLYMGPGFTSLTVTGDLTISFAKTFNVDSTGNPNIYVGGNWTATGTFSPGQSTVIMNASAYATISSLSNGIFYDGFEGESNWTLSGEFEIDVPAGLGGRRPIFDWPEPTFAYQGSNVLGVDLTGLGDCYGGYERNLGDRAYQAISPTINCTDYTNVSMSFQRWLHVDYYSSDHAYIDISNDNGVSWYNIWQNSTSMAETAWHLQTIDISYYADNQSQVKIRFCIGKTDNFNRRAGWNIDEFQIEGVYDPNNFHILEIFNPNASVSPSSDVAIDSNLFINPNGNITIEGGKNVTVGEK